MRMGSLGVVSWPTELVVRHNANGKEERNGKKASENEKNVDDNI